MEKFKVGDVVKHVEFNKVKLYIASISQTHAQERHKAKYECRQEVNGVLYTHHLYVHELQPFEETKPRGTRNLSDPSFG
jgi:hypothetical protein